MFMSDTGHFTKPLLERLCKNILIKFFTYFQVLLGVSLIFWSVCTLLSGFVTSYWQLALLRFGVGLGYYNRPILTFFNCFYLF